MSDASSPVCFTCGQHVDARRLNRLPNGEPCPSCRDRLLEALPALLPGAWAHDASAHDDLGPDPVEFPSDEGYHDDPPIGA